MQRIEKRIEQPKRETSKHLHNSQYVYTDACPIYVFSTYRHKFSLKTTVNINVRNDWEDAIVMQLIWKILAWKQLLCKWHRRVRFLGSIKTLSAQINNLHDKPSFRSYYWNAIGYSGTEEMPYTINHLR